jgi:hypothetical protein
MYHDIHPTFWSWEHEQRVATSLRTFERARTAYVVPQPLDGARMWFRDVVAVIRARFGQTFLPAE